MELSQMVYRNAIVALAISVLSVSAASAQTRGPEITVGVAAAGIESFDGDQTYTWLSLNEHFVRLAFYFTPKIAIEPDIKFNWWSGEGSSQSTIGIGVFVPFYLSGEYGDKGFYLAPGLGVNMYSSDDNGLKSSSQQLFIAAEAGKKFKLGERAAFRLAAQYYQDVENDDFAKYTNIGVLLGLSVFLK